MKQFTTVSTRLLFAVTILLVMTAMATTAWGQMVFEENFNYTAGDSLNILHGWTVQATASYVNTIKVVSPGLSYTGYASSGIGNGSKVDTTGQDIYRTFTGQSAGSIYAGFLVNITKATATGDYFFHFTEGGTANFRGRVHAKLVSGAVSFGLLKGSTGTVSYTGTTYPLSTTHLLVLKYKFNTGSATDDSVYLYVNPALGGSEPAPDLSFGSADADLASLSAVSLRQGAAASAPRLTLDGIRVGTTWQDITGPLAAPTVTTGAATGVTTTAAVLHGSVNPNNASTTDAFDYGTTLGYGSSATAAQSPIAAGGNAVATSASLSALTPNQVYHFRDPATNSQGTTNGADASFTTVPDAPVTTAATSVGPTDFTAHWTPGSGNAPTTYTLDVATDAAFTSMVSGYPLSGIAATSSVVSGLSGGTTYYYRVRGVDVGGTSANSNTTSVLTTPGAPTATAPTGVGATSFTAHWTAPSGTVTDYRLDASTDPAFGSFVSGYSNKTVAGTSDVVSGLTSATKYYYRARAVNASGTSANSNTDSATTIAASPPTVDSTTVTAVTTTTATLGAKVENDNNDPDTERGIVWATTANPTTADNKVIEGSTGVGIYTVAVSGLPAGTLIHFRGYAINSQGTGYSGDATFYTLSTEPTAHAGSFAASALSAHSIGLSWTVASGANGYIVLQKVGSDPTGTPSDASGYSVGNAIGDGSVAAVISSGATTTATVSGLTGSTDYHYSIMPFAWDGANAATYNYKTDPTIPTANATTLSSASDVIATAGFSYTSNINYTLYTGVLNIDTSNSLKAAGFTVRDGGATTDPDGAGTTLTAISLSITNSAFLSRAALYDGPTELGEVAVSSSTVSFSGLTETASDGGTRDLILRVAFKTTVTDKAQIAFTVSSVTSDSTGSGFAAGDGGAAVSSTAGDNNRIQVTATKLVFSPNVANANVNTNFTATAKAFDVNNNLDLDYGNSETFSKNSGPGTLSGNTTPTAVSGVATSTTLQFNLGGTYTLKAAGAGLSDGTSNSFVISQPGLFKVAAGPVNVPSMDGTLVTDTLQWDSTATWSLIRGGSVTGKPGKKDTVILDNTFHAGNYVIIAGNALRDSARQIIVGYPGNPNTLTLMLPKTGTTTSAFLSFGDSLPGNYDLIVDTGGVVNNSSGRTSGTALSVLGFAAAGDSIIIKPGGRFLNRSKTSISGILIGMSKDLTAPGGTFELDLFGNTTNTHFITLAGAVLPNFVLSATDSAIFYSGSTSQASSFGSCFIKGTFTVNPNATFTAGTGGSYEGDYFFKGNIVTNGTGAINFSSNTQNIMAMVGSSPQTISGNAITLGDGMFIANSAGVTLGTNVTVTGGSVRTTGTLGYLTPETLVPQTLTAAGVLNTGSSTISINPNGSMNEGSNPVLGNVSATRTATQSSNQTFGNIGYEINAAGGVPGSTVVNRKTGVASSGNGHTSILRYFDVTPTNNSGLNAAIGLSYATSELNGITETNLLLQKSTDGGTTWSGKNGTVNLGLHKITASGVNSFSRWTAASSTAPLFITHTYTLRKFADVDGSIGTSGDQSAKKWKLNLYKDSISVASLVATGNPNNGVLSTANLESGTYIATEEDSIGWLHLGKIRHGTTTGNTTTSGNVSRDTVTFTDGSPNSSDTLDFVNEQISTIAIYKFKDTDGNPNTIESAKRWHLTLYKTSVSPSNIVAEADTSRLTVVGLPAGIYIATEADSGAGWVRLNGNHARSDTLTLLANQTVADTFINFRPNSILVRKRQDNDGNFGTSADRVGKTWNLTVRDTGGALIATIHDSTLSAPSLGDNIYVISEADSANWIHLGYVLNGSPIAGGANSVTVSLINGQSTAVDFVNAPPIYSSFYRSFRQDSIANDKDNKGKVGKFVKRKADKVDFTVRVVDDTGTVSGLHMEFGAAILANYPFSTTPPSTHTSPDGKNQKWDFVFTSPVHHGDTVIVSGFGNKGKPQKVGKYYWENGTTVVGTKKKDPLFLVNQPKFPMPNRVNALFEAFEQGGFTATGGMLIGAYRATPVLDPKHWGWILAPKYSDVLKSLKGKTGLHTGYARGFDTYTSNGKPILGRQKSIPPTKQNNMLIADMIALKLNITASMLAKVPIGFGELIYDDGTSNPHNGLMVKEISALGDSLMLGWRVGAGMTPVFPDTSVFRVLDQTIQKINAAFEGAMDTLDFSAKLHMKGTRRLEDVAYMHANPSVVPAIIIPLDRPIVETPQAYTLYQNYPNPFNPTTTIQFDLMEQSVVTLKVYNLLGQEIATLLDHASMEDGQQEVNFNAGNMASGVYFYRLITQSVVDPDEEVAGQQFVGVKKMMFIK